LGLNHGKLGGMRPGFIMCLWSDGLYQNLSL
jgi:hypothetical protein